MTQLGTLTTHITPHYHRITGQWPRNRGAQPPHGRLPPRAIPLTPPQQLSQYARANARLNGAERPTYYGPSTQAAWLWQDTPETQHTADARRFNHPCQYPIAWIAPPGARSIAIKLRHNANPDALPTITIQPPTQTQLPDQHATSPEPQDTIHTITFNLTPAILSTILVTIRHNDPAPGTHLDILEIATT